MNELQELTKNMTKEFAAEKEKSSSGSNLLGGNSTTGSNKNLPGNDFGMKFEGNEADLMKELEKMLGGMGGLSGMDMNFDDSDPQTKEMMKLLSKKRISL
jgi:hypothetical protein